jgi:glycosyltransferase involved in cell wall biosynthesis
MLSGFGLNPRLPTVVTVGHLNAVKGHRHLLEAVTLLRAEGRHVQLLLVGERVNANVTHALEAQIAREGLGDLVRLVGAVEDIEPFLSAADIFVFPSLSESMGMALLEAMASGLPVVSTDVGGVAEAVEDGIQGLLVPPADPQALAQQIARMLDNPEASREMGRRAREIAVERFSTGAIADKQVRLYREMMDTR